MASTCKKIIAEAMFRVVTRSMAAGRSMEYAQLLVETAVEVDVLAAGRRERDARVLKQAHREIRAALVGVAAVARSRAVGDVDDEFRSLVGPPSWHPEHPENDGGV